MSSTIFLMSLKSTAVCVPVDVLLAPLSARQSHAGAVEIPAEKLAPIQA
jgi:hypothetical protein